MSQLKILRLTRTVATIHFKQINSLLALIPLVPHDPNELLATQKQQRKLYQKWEPSLVAIQDDHLCGVLVAYEREADTHYKSNTLYIAALSVDTAYQRQKVGTTLMNALIKQSKHAQFLLPNIHTISLQTNDSEHNSITQKFYEQLGFIQTGAKPYPNRLDRIYSLPI